MSKKTVRSILIFLNLQIMEKHKDLWRRKLAAELSRKEELEFDELGNIIHQRRQRA